MPTTSDKSEAEPAPSKPAHAEPPDVASAPLPETLAALQDNSYTGLTRGEVETRRQSTAITKWPNKKHTRSSNFSGNFGEYRRGCSN